MDKHRIKAVLEGLKSTSSSRIQEALITIKSKIITNEKGINLFKDCGGLDYLVPHLRKPNERILDISLSILGNVCLDEGCSLAVGKLNVFGSLVTILQTVKRDSIVGRACRLIGNLAQLHVNAENLHVHGAVMALVTLIENRDKNTSYPTLVMAVRAIRQLWMVAEKRDEMLGLNAVRIVSILLTVECESAGIIKSTNQDKISDQPKKSQEELITGILKCLGYFTTYAHFHCAEQIQGDGRGYQCLVALTSNYENLALKCLMNLCYLSTCRPLLGTAGFVECLVGILQKCSEPSLWPDGAVKALSHLSEDSVNRARLRHCRGLGLLVAAAREYSNAMPALLQYVFDDMAFQILINEGLVGLLTDKLVTFLQTMKYEHNNREVIVENKTEAEPSVEATASNPKSTASNTKSGLLKRRRRQNSSSATEDDLEVVIERDNMIVGFLDNTEADSDDDSDESCKVNKCSKRHMEMSSEPSKKKTKIMMAAKDWSPSVYWEPKSPEWPTYPQQLPRVMSPDRFERSPVSPYSDSNNSALSPEYRGSSCKRARWDWSPESGFSTGEGSSASPSWAEYPWSPGSSASVNSPFSFNENSSDSEISGRYSPVCSEADVENEGSVAIISNNVVDVTQDLDELIVDDEEDTPLKEDDVSAVLETSTQSSSIGCILILLFCVSAGGYNSQGTLREESPMNNVVELLNGKECVNALLDYIARCKNPLGRAARILAKIFSNTLCITSILKHRLALRLHEMSMNSKHPTTSCIQCKQILRLCVKYLLQLTKLAESSHGMGEICYQLLKGSIYMKETLSLTLPYIVRTEKTLKKYFVDCSALKLLIQIINESKEDIQHCVIALSKLANNVHIKDPKILENRYQEEVNIDYDPVLDDLSKDDIVTFELDDLSTVRANRTFLCQNSDVFSAMLMGQFKESAEKNVKLKNVTKPALEYLLTLLHCGVNNPKVEVNVFPMATELETNLEVLLLADRFLFERLKELLCSAILQFQMTPENADKIYIWSLNEGMGFLCVESVAYLLTGKMCETERTRSFQNILCLQYKDQWLDDIETMILRQLRK